MEQPLVSIRDLHLRFRTYAGIVHALNGIDLSIFRNEALGLVGETGCGKSMTGRSIMRLIPPGGEIASGSIRFDGEELLTKPESYMQEIRGARMAMIFQDPAAALNPVFTIGEQIRLVISRHQQLSNLAVRRKALEILDMVELPDPPGNSACYPHELSGGMKQRASIAIALSSGPELLIADEPTTALDTTVQAQILDLLSRLRVKQGVAMLLITHDLAVVAESCQRVTVLYAGQVVETGPVDQVLLDPKHPYTQALVKAAPRPNSRGTPLRTIPGAVPTGLTPLSGCPFSLRCPYVIESCTWRPPALHVGPGHSVACFLYTKEETG